MVLWRISNHADLLGIGGTVASARWHSAGRPVVYLAESPASALLEVLVHLEVDEAHQPDTYQLLKVQAADDLPFDEVAHSSLSEDWKSREQESRARGDDWLERGETCLLRVPSAIVAETWNWLLNPRHPRAREISILQSQRHLYDTRLL